MAIVNVRIEDKVKKAATRALGEIGLDMSSAIKLFLTQVVTEKGLPFTPTKNPAVLRTKWDREVVHALKHGKVYTSGKDILEDL